MEIAVGQKPIREGSAEKRAKILSEARDLFVRSGVDRVSMDAIASAAGVSKVTVYDYFGDKRRLFLAILADASDTLTETGRRVLSAHLGDDAQVSTVAALEHAIVETVLELSETVHSVSYAAVFALVSQQRTSDTAIDDDVSTEWLEEALAARIAHFADLGLLEVENPRLAASHLAALTMLLAYNEQPDPARADPDRLRQTMTDGVHAFIRAYGTRGEGVATKRSSPHI